MAPGNSEESVFNMALSYLERINKILTLCSLHSMNNRIEQWNSSLMCLHRELSIKISDIEEESFIGNAKTDLKFSKVGNIVGQVKSENATINNINILCNNIIYLKNNRKEILYLMHQLEIKYRRLMQKKGMLLPSKEDSMWAITKN